VKCPRPACGGWLFLVKDEAAPMVQCNLCGRSWLADSPVGQHDMAVPETTEYHREGGKNSKRGQDISLRVKEVAEWHRLVTGRTRS